MTSAVISPAHPERILKGLGKVWTSVGQEEKQQGRPTVLRACAMTLVIATDEPDGGGFASQTIAELMRDHPNRGVVLAISPDAPAEPEAEVLAQFWKPFGKAQQIGCEEIQINAKPESWTDVSQILFGLTAADLPVMFWCRHGGALCAAASQAESVGLKSVMDLATKTIIDSRGMPAAQVLDLFSKWRRDGYIVADLEWTRLTSWRQPLAHVFDNPARENVFGNFHTIEIGHTEPEPSARDFYLAGWLSAPFNAQARFKKVEGFGPGLHSVTLLSDSETITFERTGLECMTIQSTSGRQRGFSYPEPSTNSLMTEELSITGTDPAFDIAFKQARKLHDRN